RRWRAEGHRGGGGRCDRPEPDTRSRGMTQCKHCGWLLTLACGAIGAQPPPEVAPLLSKELADIPGKEVLMLTVEYPPGGADPVHRHDAHGFVYVLEGSIVMQVQGGEEVTLAPGQTFYEGPHDVHTV